MTLQVQLEKKMCRKQVGQKGGDSGCASCRACSSEGRKRCRGIWKASAAEAGSAAAPPPLPPLLPRDTPLLPRGLWHCQILCLWHLEQSWRRSAIDGIRHKITRLRNKLLVHRLGQPHGRPRVDLGERRKVTECCEVKLPHQDQIVQQCQS